MTIRNSRNSNQFEQFEVQELVQEAATNNLKELDIGNKNLFSVPLEVFQLTHLRSLTLNCNYLSSLPPEIGRLINLQTLNLSSNRLNSLPWEIGNLTKLQTLNLSGNYINTLPTAMGKVTRLQSLNLSSNQFSSLPLEICKLSNLRQLNLSSNQLHQLPPEIKNLIRLHTLEVSNNQIDLLSPEVFRFVNLSVLDLRYNQLSTLPPEICKFINLTQLDISRNQLITLPLEIFQLNNLSVLNLNGNRLSVLPPEISYLTNLKTLSFCDNQLSKLPPEISQLTGLTTVGTEGNFLPQLPPEIRQEGCQAILNFYRQISEEETDFLYEAKLLIVGEAGAGKTTLAKKIQDQKYQLQQDEISTEGIDIHQWGFQLDNNKEFQVNIWDFGGQEIYHSTHQFFLTKRSLYVLVADTRKEDTDFFYWLNLVELLSTNSPLLIIKNEKQDRQREINERQLRGEFTNLKETLATNLAINRGLEEILTTIKHYITRLPHVGTELPRTWVKVRETLECDPRNYISLDEYLLICQKNGFTSFKDKLQLSGYLHDLGICLHFQDDDLLMKTVILKPTWGTDAVYKVLDNSKIIENMGQFNRDDLANIWHENKYHTMRAELLRLMMNFKLCYEIPSCPGTYIAPQLLSPNQPDYSWENTNNLLLRYEYEFMPKGILTRFIVEMHSWIEKQTCVWKNGVVLNKDRTRAEIVEYYRYHKGEIRIRIFGNHKRDLLTAIRHELEKIHRSYERLRFSTLVPCNCEICKENQKPYFYPLRILYKFLEDKQNHIQCQTSYQMVKVRELLDDIEPEPNPRKWQNRFHRKTQDKLKSSNPTIIINNQNENTQENPMSNINQHHYGRGDNVAGNKTLNQFNNSPNLVQAARDIKELLDQLSNDYPSDTLAGQAMIGAKAIEQIENNPTLRQRIVNALKEAGATALEEAVDHPAVKIVVAGTKGFIDA
ncbi:COR domain-containing protein [Nostoc commune]|uniref:COR domain-containing protein n=1 Tax=Nostoc commune TaxID=1178 RepID=UPI0018C75DB8|nr:COR domain-containing protein [Nostoc commune]MBG1258115.1 GTPase [Nostoc commune BAE]